MRSLLLPLLVLLQACSGAAFDVAAPQGLDTGAEEDALAEVSGETAGEDGGSDALPLESGDTGVLVDSGKVDTGAPDTGAVDSGSPDIGAPDTGLPETDSGGPIACPEIDGPGSTPCSDVCTGPDAPSGGFVGPIALAEPYSPVKETVVVAIRVAENNKKTTPHDVKFAITLTSPGAGIGLYAATFYKGPAYGETGWTPGKAYATCEAPYALVVASGPPEKRVYTITIPDTPTNDMAYVTMIVRAVGPVADASKTWKATVQGLP